MSKNNTDINLLKPGQTGFGLMIENDAGYISPEDSRNKDFINEVNKISKGEVVMSEPLKLFVVLQKYGVENRNGRIYPKYLLEREGKNYQELINNNAATGECVPKDTEIYTKNGWAKIQDVLVGDEVYTLNTKTNTLEIEPVERTTRKDYDDDMIHIYNSSNLDMMITKKHKVVLWDRNDVPYILTGEELFNKINDGDSKVSHSTIKHSGEWIGEDVDTINIPNSDYIIDSELWAAFLGIFLADGHTSYSKGGSKKNITCITQVKSESKNKIKKLLDKLPFEYRLSDDRQFLINDKALFDFLSPLGNSSNKFIPEYAKSWSPRLLNVLIDWMLLDDGRNRKSRKGDTMKEYYTISDKLSDDVFEVFLKISNGATYNTRIQKDRYITDVETVDKEVVVDGELQLVKESVKVKRLIKGDDSEPLNIVSERTSNGISLDTRFIKAEKVPFDDEVFCVTVNNGTWLMRYNDKISWTHNSDHPESSIVSINRISHAITKIWWEGKTLVGEIDIIMSPGFIRYGIISCEGDRIANLLRRNIRIGVSSRGVGSLEEIDGKSIVQDDFELICWDIVTSPSTPGSYMFKEPKDAKPFMESKTKQNTLLDKKLDNFLLG